MLWLSLVWPFTVYLNSDQHTVDMGEGGVKNPEKLPTSFMDGPYVWQCMAGIQTLSYETIGKM